MRWAAPLIALAGLAMLVAAMPAGRETAKAVLIAHVDKSDLRDARDRLAALRRGELGGGSAPVAPARDTPTENPAEGGSDQPWDEDASLQFRSAAARTPWANRLGDWVDAAGAPLGAKPFAIGQVAQVDQPTKVRIDVTALVREHGADLRINALGGLPVFATRESGANAPTLTVTGPGGTRTLTATADTEMNPSTQRPLGTEATMNAHWGVLIRFAQGPDPQISRAMLTLTAIKVFHDSARLLVFRNSVLDAPATPAAGAIADLAGWKQSQPVLGAQGELRRPAAPAASARPARVLVSVRGSDLKVTSHSRHEGDVLTAWIEGSNLTATEDLIRVPGSPTEAYLTVILKLHDDWRATGGKLPGLTNTGQVNGDQHLCTMGGQALPFGGWGARPANGCYWSARTQFMEPKGDRVGAATYFYAQKPNDINGVNDWWRAPLPKGRWVAYVERVKLNTPGRDDGELAYWLIDRGRAPGGKLVQSAGGIVWRSTADPTAAINELWVDTYCGGSDCGPKPWPRSTVSYKRLTVTDGLPDLAAIQAELDRMNGVAR
jgi:hypothetical protein